ncbi:MAG: hypothetical protein WKF84_24910 [Pyrinomonadaceae bacterium]
MRKDELIYVGHMLDVARATTALWPESERAAYDQDKTLRYAPAHLLQTDRRGGTPRVTGVGVNGIHTSSGERLSGMRHKIVHVLICSSWMKTSYGAR